MDDTGQESVRVIVRLRPEEKSHDARKGGQDLTGSCIHSIEDQKLTIFEPHSRGSAEGRQAYDFSFDRVFGPDATQSDVFEMVKPLVDATVDGYTTTVFGYGSTGAGKTHTISGVEGDPGILPLSVELLFDRLATDAASGSDKAFMVFVTYIEIYNNKFHNLLDGSAHDPAEDRVGGAWGSGKAPNGGPEGGPVGDVRRQQQQQHKHASKIEIREHPSRGVFLSAGGGGRGLRVPVTSAASVMRLIDQGLKARHTASTSLNDRSSRSHAILILEIEANEKEFPEVVEEAGSGAGARAGGRA
ncbi:unnamed protein product, partial [Discosporangium mesarthrocarpum]